MFSVVAYAQKPSDIIIQDQCNASVVPHKIIGDWNGVLTVTPTQLNWITVLVLDATTHTPIVGASVWFPSHPKFKEVTGMEGTAVLKMDWLPCGEKFQTAFLGYVTSETMVTQAESYTIYLQPE